MSRSTQSEHLANPATRFFEWNGTKGNLRYYDREKKEQVEVPLPFTFLLLDELSTVRGWHDHSESGIYANEVRDTRVDPLVVKAFKFGTIASGLYADVKDKVKQAGGKYHRSCYIGYKREMTSGALVIGNLMLKGAALGIWMEFVKNSRSELYRQAITISGFDEGKKGSIRFRLPIFELKEIGKDTQEASKHLDGVLQGYLDHYLLRTKSEQAQRDADTDDEDTDDGPQDIEPVGAPLTDDDIPF